ncbi:STAS domain-containing protein [Streptomyces virginiae]|uniref:STAS domain-containing protein n=1 Tax=Streptomyces virginiae TaxID=1961 RepID=UPI00365827FF
MDFCVMPRCYGPTVCLAPAGELDLDSRAVLDELYMGADEATVVACDMRHLTFMDVTGLDGLIDFAGRLDGRSLRFFAHSWQPQPSRLLDALYPPAGAKGIRGGPTRLLRRTLP